jgi:hypothetical protein
MICELCGVDAVNPKGDCTFCHGKGHEPAPATGPQIAPGYDGYEEQLATKLGAHAKPEGKPKGKPKG